MRSSASAVESAPDSCAQSLVVGLVAQPFELVTPWHCAAFHFVRHDSRSAASDKRRLNDG